MNGRGAMKTQDPQPSALSRFLRDPAQAWTRVFILVTLFLVTLFLLLWVLLTPITAQERWGDELRRHVATLSPEESGALRPFVEALSQVHWPELEDAREELYAVATLSDMPSPGIVGLASRYRTVIQQIGMAASAEATRFPSLVDAVEPISRPGMREMENLSLLLTSTALLRVFEGHALEGCERLLEAMLVGAMLCRPEEEANLSLHLAGFALMEYPAGALRELLHHWTIDEEAWESILETLETIETRRHPIAGAILAEYRLVGNSISETPERPAELADILQFYDSELGREAALARAFTHFKDVVTVPGDLPRFLDALRQALEENTPPAPNTLTAGQVRALADNPMIHVNTIDPAPLLLRETDLVARLRLLRGLGYHKLGRGEALTGLIDPYSGDPFLIDEERIFSVGRGGDGPHLDLDRRGFRRRMGGHYRTEQE